MCIHKFIFCDFSKCQHGEVDDLNKFLPQARLRPHVVLKLCLALLSSGYPFKDEAEKLRQRFVRQVALRYPETEGHIPEDLREGCIPPPVEAAIRESLRPVPGEKESAVKHKHATPVDAPRTTALALADLRPSSGFPDRNSHNMVPQDAQQLIALRKQYFLTASTDVDLLPQWNTNFFAQAFPFSIPRVVGGADFPWKPRPRRAEQAPFLDPQSWTRMLATRVEASVRNDWVVVPSARNLATKYKALRKESESIAKLNYQEGRPGCVRFI